MISFPHSLLPQAISLNRPDQNARLRFQGASSSPKKSSQQNDTFQSNRDDGHAGSRVSSPAPDLEMLGNAGSHPEESSLSQFLQTLARLTQYSDRVDGSAQGLNPNVSDEYGDTLLMFAAGTGNAPLTKLLVTMGGQVNAQNPHYKNYTPLIMAILADAPTCVKALLASPELDVNLADAEGNAPLAYAVRGDDLSVVKRLLKRGANPNQRNQDGMTPLSQACLIGNPRMVQALLAAKADPNMADSDGDTPLLIAVATGNMKVVKALLKANANPTHWNHHDISPLGSAILQHNQPLAQMLLDYGAQPDALNNRGQTLLTQLCHVESSDLVDLLLSLGADVNQPDFRGISPLKQAILSSQPQVVSRLLAEPSLTGRSDLEQAWQAMKGEDELSESARFKLAHALTAPFFAEPLRQNPEIDLVALFRRFSRVSQNLQNNPRLRAFKEQSPEDYNQYCVDYLMDLVQPPEGATQEGGPQGGVLGLQGASGQFRSQFSQNAQAQNAQEGQTGSSQLPRRIVTGHNYLLSPLNAQRINTNLERRLTELRQERPAAWRKMRADELYRLFDNHVAIVQAKLENPADYLLACKAFLGLVVHCFNEMDENPIVAHSLTPQSYQKFFRAEITQVLDRKQLHPEMNTFELHNLLTLP